jgi:uncharacterized protein
VKGWFGKLAEMDDIQKFEPREFLEGPNHVTVLGWEQIAPKPNGKVFESEWVHVFTVRDGKVSRWIGTLDTAAYVAAGR